MSTYEERELERVLPVRPIGGGLYEPDDGRLQRKIDVDTSPLAIYVGYATKGVATSAATWTIKKITLNAAGNPTAIQWSDERAVTWEGRVGGTYT